MLDRGLKNKGKEVFDEIKENASKVDLMVGNLESILGTTPDPQDKQINFIAHPRWAKIIFEAGFDVLTIANNHSYDQGFLNLLKSEEILLNQNLKTIGGVKNPVQYFKFKGKTLGLVGLSFFGNSPNSLKTSKSRKKVKILLKEIREKSDFIFVTIHWGIEYDHTPHPNQLKTLKWLENLGADFVVGHHPHVLQSVGIYKKVPVLFSLGNFVFDQSSSSRRETLFSKINLGINGDQLEIKSIELEPWNIQEKTWIPQQAKNKKKESIKKKILKYSSFKTQLLRDYKKITLCKTNLNKSCFFENSKGNLEFIP